MLSSSSNYFDNIIEPFNNYVSNGENNISYKPFFSKNKKYSKKINNESDNTMFRTSLGSGIKKESFVNAKNNIMSVIYKIGIIEIMLITIIIGIVINMILSIKSSNTIEILLKKYIKLAKKTNYILKYNNNINP